MAKTLPKPRPYNLPLGRQHQVVGHDGFMTFDFRLKEGVGIKLPKGKAESLS
jgi:hypothetical protein